MVNNCTTGKSFRVGDDENKPLKTVFSWKQLQQIFPFFGVTALLLFLISFRADSRFISLLRRSSSKLGHQSQPADSLQPETGYSRHAWCLLYDKAPRTGSTTVARSLANCWKSIPNIHVTTRKGKFNSAVPTLLETPYRHVVALVGSHFSISISDIGALHSKCEHVLYVTSTRAMPERLWSEAKYVVSKTDIRHNSSLAADDLPLVWSTLFERLHQSEPYFESYPFETSYQKSETSSRDLIPSYVIRTEQMYDDLSLLLKAFQCSDDNIQVTNMHTIELDKNENTTIGMSGIEFQDVPKNLSRVPLQFDDYRNKYLLQLAESVNEKGILAAKQLATLLKVSRSQ